MKILKKTCFLSFNWCIFRTLFGSYIRWLFDPVQESSALQSDFYVRYVFLTRVVEFH